MGFLSPELPCLLTQSAVGGHPIETISVLLLEDGQARLTTFSCENKGELVCPAGELDLGRALERFKPDLVILRQSPEMVENLAQQLTRGGPAVLLVCESTAQSAGRLPEEAALLPEPINPASLKELLGRLAQASLAARRESSLNPLTRLPGSSRLKREIERRLAAGRAFAFLYLDMDNFKAYNDYYGFAQGDLAIQMLSRLLAETAKQAGGPEAFCAHIGGDDFAAVLEPEKASELASLLLERFGQQIQAFYRLEDRERGYIVVANRQGEETRYPVMSLSVVGVDTSQRRLNSYLELSSIAAELKTYAKSVPGSIFVQDRRRDGEKAKPAAGKTKASGG